MPNAKEKNFKRFIKDYPEVLIMDPMAFYIAEYARVKSIIRENQVLNII